MSRCFALLALLLLALPAGAQFEKAALAWTMPWDPDWVTAVAFTGPRQLVVGNKIGQIIVYELPDQMSATTPQPVRRLEGHENTISRLLATPDGKLISASYDRTIRIWDMNAPASGKDKLVLNARTREDLIRRRSSKVPKELTAEVTVHKCESVLQGHKDWIVGMDLSRDGQLLVSGDDAGTVIVWERASGKEVRRWQVKGWAHAVAVAPDKSQVLVTERVPLVFDSGRHTGIKIWDPASGQIKFDLEKEFKGQYLSTAIYNPDGKSVYVARGGETDTGKVSMIDTKSGKKLREFSPGHQSGATDLAFHPDGKHLASCGRDTLVRLWNASTGKMVKELGKARGGQFKDWICAVAFSPDGRWLAGADMAGMVQVWALTAGGVQQGRLETPPSLSGSQAK